MENSNSPQTGSPMPTNEGLRPISGLIPTPRRMSTATISTSAKANPSGETLPAGTTAGKSGAALTPSEAGRWERAQLGPLNLPEATKRSTTNSLLSAIVHEPQSRWDAAGNLIHSPPRFRMKPGSMSRPDIQQNLRAVVAGLERATPAQIAPVVATLKARTRGRNEGEGEARFNANVLIQDLCDYPADVVKAACEAWIDTSEGKWFPAWADLKALCEERVRGRRALLKGLNWMLEQTA